ncbi:MAG: phosphodiester glycosidase family protein [Eubacteriales bacterium]|nr:phosphodiester glycosidase family protein [Eubacteriales bacterium]
MSIRTCNPRKRLVQAILLDLLAVGVCLNVFAYFHHVRKADPAPKALNSPTPAAAAQAEVGSETDVASAAQPSAAVPAATEAPEAADTGLLGGKFAEKFSTGDAEQTDDGYRSKNVCIELSKVSAGTEDRPIVYYVADIYIKDLSSFRTALAYEYKDQNEGSRKNVMSTLQLSELTNALVAISGDNYTFRKEGLIAVRNGVEWYNQAPLADDICVLYYDGTMETYRADETRDEQIAAIYAKEPYQIWTFGPELLENGEIPEKFSINKENPLSGIGYFEPGHYCFILVDGRQSGYSWGMNYTQFAQVFKDLGCKTAYNLDGGDTAVMTFNGAWRSHPQDEKPRETSDILYICEPSASASGQ